jgi:acetyltransferase-like isoleucine patch superfamily enzyme
MQSKKNSAFEAATNVFIGYLVSVAANVFVLPAFGYDVTIGDSFAIGAAFTIISLVRSYALRRLFNKIEEWKDA